MNILLAGVVSVLAVAAPAQSQSPGLTAAAPITITFMNSVTLEEALSTLSRLSGVVMEISSTVPDEVRRQPVYPESPISLREVTLEQAVEMVTRLKGLSYGIVDARMVLVFKKP